LTAVGARGVADGITVPAAQIARLPDPGVEQQAGGLGLGDGSVVPGAVLVRAR
jgi:hypothetical protein